MPIGCIAMQSHILCFFRFFGVSRGFFNDRGVRIKVVGDLSFVGNRLRNAAMLAEEKTRHNHRLTLRICVAYGSRNEVTRCLQNASTCCCSYCHEASAFCVHDGVEDGRRQFAPYTIAAFDSVSVTDPKCVFKPRQRCFTVDFAEYTCHGKRNAISMPFCASVPSHQPTGESDDSATVVHRNIPLCQQLRCILLEGQESLGDLLRLDEFSYKHWVLTLMFIIPSGSVFSK